jgi:hypothetical protein
MDITITMDDEYADILREQPALVTEFQRAATLVAMNALEKKRRVMTYPQGYTGNGFLQGAAIDCGVMTEPPKPEP